MEKFSRTTDLLFTLFFYSGAYFQLNDRDAALWVPIYLCPAVICSIIVVYPRLRGSSKLELIKRIHLVYCVAILVYVCLEWYGIYNSKTLDSQSHDAPETEPGSPLNRLFQILEAEQGRETAGIAIVVVWSTFGSHITNNNRTCDTRSIGQLKSAVTFVVVALALLLWGICYTSAGSNIGYCQQIALNCKS